MTTSTAMKLVVCAWLAAICSRCLDPTTAQTFADDVPLLHFTATVDLGKDVGQSFGTIFESSDSEGRVVMGAGFMDVYNTRFRVGRRTLEFYLRHDQSSDKVTISRLPHPDLDCGVYLFALGGELYAWSSARGDMVRRWDAAQHVWHDESKPPTGSLRSGDAVMCLDDGLLVMRDNQVTYDGRTVLSPPETGRYYNFYYAGGRLFFYHTAGADGDKRTSIYACPWTYDSQSPIDLAEAEILQAKYGGATPFAWGQHDGDVLTVSNYGGIYVFRDGSWQTLLEADDQVSYQVYSMLNYYDRLLLAQYPTGNLFAYTGDVPQLITGWPPRLAGVSPSAREAQTLAIYAGNLFVGVWPWAELWRYDDAMKKWHSLGRMFTHPQASEKTVHPYEAEAERNRLVTNHWGQRVTSMIPLGDSLYLSTSSKGTSPWLKEYTFLTESQRREYGAVLQLKIPGNVATEIEWTGRPMKLDFIVTGTRMLVRQDGRRLAAANYQPPPDLASRRWNTTWGQGVFGRFSGAILDNAQSP